MPSKTAILAAAMLVAACSTDDESVTQLELRETEATEAQRGGSLLVEFNPATSNGVSVHAQFLEVHGVSLEAAFDALDAWSPDAALDEDACSIRVPPEPSEETPVRLHLVDVGPIAVTALDHAIALEGRRVPDLQAVSGVVYGNEGGFDFDEAFLPYQPFAQYQISAPGSDEASGFGIALHAPAMPRIEAISGHYVVDDEPIALNGDDLTLNWEVATEPVTALYLDVTAGSQRLQCRVEDDGHFVVPASVLNQLPSDRTLRVVLRRVDSLDLPLDGVDRTTFVFAAAAEALIRP